jgi:TolB-like protein
MLAYLLLERRAISRSDLCDLLWDGPTDPRAELRWCLSKLRPLFQGTEGWRLDASRDAVEIHLESCSVDVLELSAINSDGLDHLNVSELERLATMFAGTFLSGILMDNCPQFDAWAAGHRRRIEERHVAVLKELTGRGFKSDQPPSKWAERWLQITPFDLDAHRALLQVLVSKRQVKAADEHVEASISLFQAEGMNLSPLRELWRELRSGGFSAAQVGQRLETEQENAAATEKDQSHRVVLAVMPFKDVGVSHSSLGGIGDGLTHDIITRLAKLRAFPVIARGSVYAVAEKGFDPQQVGRALEVQYVANGVVEHIVDRAIVSIELVNVETAGIVWSGRFEAREGDLFSVLDDIGSAIVAAIASEIETAERDRAILKPPTSLSAWEAYHRGLWHMYRFTKAENKRAADFFRTAVSLDPTFARAQSGLSFTYWQSAFQGWDSDSTQVQMAYQAASESLFIDSQSPESHWAMGRALWLMGDNEGSLSELSVAVDLSPHFALGHYALAFVQSQSGDAAAAILSAEESRHLSPYDPLLFGMLGARAMGHVRLGQFEEAADWAVKAAARPNAHVGILAIAANCLGLAGRVDDGRAFAARIHSVEPEYNVDNFLHSFRFKKEGADLFRKGAGLIGLG